MPDFTSHPSPNLRANGETESRRLNELAKVLRGQGLMKSLKDIGTWSKPKSGGGGDA